MKYKGYEYRVVSDILTNGKVIYTVELLSIKNYFFFKRKVWGVWRIFSHTGAQCIGHAVIPNIPIFKDARFDSIRKAEEAVKKHLDVRYKVDSFKPQVLV